MKAIRIQQFGGPEVLRLQETAVPRPSGGEILLRIQQAGVNYIDTYHRKGLYPVPLPFSPGIEGVGVVEELGPGVESRRVGETVVFCLGMGGYAEYAVIPAWKTTPLPAGVTPDQALACMCQGMTAHYLVTDCFSLKRGDTALVHAAAGGVGLLLVQMVKGLGGVVLATVSTETKAELASKAGADHVVLYEKQDFASEARRLTSGRGVDVVYESVGRSTFARSLDCLRPRGYVVLYGQSSGPVGPLDPQVLNQKGSLFLTRPSLGDYVSSPREFEARAGAVLGMVQQGRLAVTVGDRFPLAEAEEAHRRLEGRRTFGKVILTV